jgi:hypothetical protein
VSEVEAVVGVDPDGTELLMVVPEPIVISGSGGIVVRPPALPEEDDDAR